MTMVLALLLAVTPKIVQYVSSSTNEQGSGTTDVGSGTARNNYEFTTGPNPVGAGNCLVLAVTFQRDVGALVTGDTVSSITDSSGDTWSTTPAASVGDGATTNPNVRIFTKGNATAGEHVLIVTLSASQATFQYNVFELYGTDCAADGSGSNTGQSGTTFNGGTFTPTSNNDVFGGHVVLSVFTSATNATSPPTGWAAGAGFKLLVADTAQKSDQYAHAAMYGLMPARYEVTPQITRTGGSGVYTGLSIALKAAAAGTDPDTSITGIHVNSIQHTTNGLPPATWTFQTPSTGNLIVGVTPSASSCCLIINSVTDNKGNSWTATNGGDTDAVWIFYCTAPCTTGEDLKITINAGATHINSTVLIYDISNAATSGTKDGEVTPVGSNMSCTGSSPPGDTTSTNTCPEDVFHAFSGFTPASVGLTLATCAYGTGPSRGFHDRLGNQLTRPTGAVWNYVWYTGITDNSRMDNSDCQAHYYNNDLSSQTWDFNLDWQYYSPANNGTTAFPHLIHFKGASVAPPAPAPPVFHFKRYRAR